MAYKLGKLDPDPSRVTSHVALSDDAPVAQPPPVVNWFTGDTDADPLGNDDVGNCTCADEGHMVNQVLALLGDPTAPVVTSVDTLAMYRAISGYDGTEATDQGAQISDALDYMLAVGLAGVKIDAHAAVNWQNQTLLDWCIADFLGVHLGVQLPASAFDQTDAGQPWTPVRRSPIEGGHDIYVGGYNRQTGMYNANSWGKQVLVSAAFIQEYADEAHVSAVARVLEAPAFSKYSTQTLDQQWDSVTGSLQLPFERPIN